MQKGHAGVFVQETHPASQPRLETAGKSHWKGNVTLGDNHFGKTFNSTERQHVKYRSRRSLFMDLSLS